MRHLTFVPILLALLAIAPPVQADDPDPAESGAFAIERLYQDVRLLVRRYYPDATAHRLGDKIHFEDRTRVFVVHDPLKTGEWQDPVEERGPRMGGVHGDIELRPGRYDGAAAVPQAFDKRYFVVHLYAPYSKRADRYLYVHLKLPSLDTPKGFREEFEALIGNLEAYSS
jgi:hypothetical protein